MANEFERVGDFLVSPWKPKDTGGQVREVYTRDGRYAGLDIPDDHGSPLERAQGDKR